MYKFEHQQVVRFSDTDAAGIVYFGAFATFFDESFLAAIRSKGIGWEEHRIHGFLLPIVEQHIKFLFPVRASDTIRVEVGVSLIKNRSFSTQHVVYLEKDGENIQTATGTISRVVVDYDSFEPIIIPDKLLVILKEFNKILF